MPFNPQNIDVNDLNPNIGLGINLPFTGSGVFNLTYNTQEAIKNNLINYFLTNPGERPLNPTFGGGLKQFIFEQVNDLTFNDIKSQIQNKISLVFPTIKINKLDIYSSPQEENNIIINLQYNITNTFTTGSLTFNF
jgi:phage baseplate assembly protein W